MAQDHRRDESFTGVAQTRSRPRGTSRRAASQMMPNIQKISFCPRSRMRCHSDRSSAAFSFTRCSRAALRSGGIPACSSRIAAFNESRAACGLRRSRETQRPLVRRQSRCNRIVHALFEFFPLLESVLRRVDRLEKLDQDFAGMHDQGALLHHALRSRAGHRHDGNAGFDGHHHGPFLEFLQAAIGASGPFRIYQERLPILQRLGGFFERGNRVFVPGAVHRNEVRQAERRADNGHGEQRFFQQDGDAPGNRADHGGRVGRACVVRHEQAGAAGNSLQTFYAESYADGAHEKTHSAHAGPVQRVGIPRNHRVQQQRNSRHDDVQAQKNRDKECAQHLSPKKFFGGVPLAKSSAEKLSRIRGAASRPRERQFGACAAAAACVLPVRMPSRMRRAFSPAFASSAIWRETSLDSPRAKSSSLCAPLRTTDRRSASPGLRRRVQPASERGGFPPFQSTMVSPGRNPAFHSGEWDSTSGTVMVGPVPRSGANPVVARATEVSRNSSPARCKISAYGNGSVPATYSRKKSANDAPATFSIDASISALSLYGLFFLANSSFIRRITSSRLFALLVLSRIRISSSTPRICPLV